MMIQKYLVVVIRLPARSQGVRVLFLDMAFRFLMNLSICHKRGMHGLLFRFRLYI